MTTTGAGSGRHRHKVGLALAGGGPIGAIYEIGALVALEEALVGADFTEFDVYVGVSAGAFLAAGLANGLTPRAMYRSFIESDAADDPFEPDILLKLALPEFKHRLRSLPGLIGSALSSYLEDPFGRSLTESFQSLSRAIPAGLFDNSGIGHYLEAMFSAPGRSNDFRALGRRLFLVATELDTGLAVPFGSAGRDDVPISLAVQASAALPGLFPPVRIGDRHYVDGALKKTLHASVALKEGARLLLCLNPLVPFDAALAARRSHGPREHLVDGGLPVVLSQTFRAIIHSRMRVGMERYRQEFPGADVVLFEPARDDRDMFFTNVFSYASRRRLSEHAYRNTRAELLARYEELTPILARHGLAIDRDVLLDGERSLGRRNIVRRSRAKALGRAVLDLDQTLERLEGWLRQARAPQTVVHGE